MADENVVVSPLFPRPYGFDAKDRKVIGFIHCVKIPSRQRRSISQAFDLLYEDGLYLIHHFVYLKRKITFYTWEIVFANTNGSYREYVCDLSFCDEGIILQINCQMIKKYLEVELTCPVDDIRIYDCVQRVLYSRQLIEQFQSEWRCYQQK
jgi:hypothetical protein